MLLLSINVSSLILLATQVHSTIEGSLTHESLLTKYADVFKMGAAHSLLSTGISSPSAT